MQSEQLGSRTDEKGNENEAKGECEQRQNRISSTNKALADMCQVMFVAGTANVPASSTLVDVLVTALRGGITSFQYREKPSESKLTPTERFELALQLRQLCRTYAVPFFVNDDVHLATVVDADGIHLGQEDMPLAEARRKMPHAMIGLSAHNVEEARSAVALGADYIGVGPMFMTNTKLHVRPVQGPQVIAAIRAAELTIPMVGIGGITVERIQQVMNAGADGVAVVSHIASASDVFSTVKALKKEVVLHKQR
ncbi:thiamine phosphate synthase [Paenibacillus sp. 481]|uniref:thiamine phosphate synthase n=1 Tax=Paenibacillus sp. 481 TaxID=2835869 RepID=UPI001E369961|nr:thiamine phosphate synthase [Paenibacillus sp. 481]UHA73115.1 thiamine phosphate synthase [Paenibacillus sp. 481]